MCTFSALSYLSWQLSQPLAILMNNASDMGVEVANLAKRILNGEFAKDTPIVPKSNFFPTFDYRQLHRFDFDSTSRLFIVPSKTCW